MVVQFSKKRKFVADGIFKAELNEVLIQELAEDKIITLATRTQNVLDEKVWQIRELTAVVQKRFGFSEGKVELYGLLWCAMVHHGEWDQRLQGHCVWETLRTEG
uniref:Uncharacterized protein n=1 Tax=Cercocebus atys TaxID=9531 RepID=A0A2K5NM34_CERAT